MYNTPHMHCNNTFLNGPHAGYEFLDGHECDEPIISLVDIALYNSKYPKSTLRGDEFASLAEAATLVVNEFCLHRLTTWGQLYRHPKWVIERILRAVCVQINLLENQGGEYTLQGWGADSAINYEKIGAYNYSRAGKSSSRTVDNGDYMLTIYGIPVSPQLRMILFPTGLLYAGVGIVGV